ncbi:MAG: outer membrane lipoprotein chaperone LolA [Burkholderiales bacterium]|nr:MAG: outer membrane lipoprotein chaperone LolA [Burkholderiales bacterium]
MMKKTTSLIVSALLLLAAHGASAAGLESLEAFIKSTKSGRAEFSQVVTSPPKDGQAGKTKTSTGSFEFQRPNRFRFVYKKPFEQTIVADGQTLWLYDVDLNQVTARKQAQALGASPAALVASASDLGALQKDFNLQGAPDKDGLQWVVATPKSRDAQLQSVRVGFRGLELAALEILDSFGQRSVMSFSKVEVNPALGAEAFSFKPPAGADVIRQ